ncbi:MAG: HIT domain-containing protein [Patescibacteria group bacterium]|nr:HIT domain-containing protein [Patescibacteria group bacterium]
MDCVFCKIIAKELPSEYIEETDSCIVIKDIYPQAPIHLLVIPKTHYPEFLDMPDDLLSHLFSVAKSVIKKHNIQSYRLVNNGKGAAIIDHFHVHILGKVEKERKL